MFGRSILENPPLEAKNDSSDLDDTAIYPPFLPHLTPKEVEFTALFPEFPKSHEEGYATVIDLSDELLGSDESQVMNLLKGMQYSRSNQGGGGIRIKDHVEFFAKDDDDNEESLVPMGYHTRKCAGVKVCEFFPDPSSGHIGCFLLIMSG